MKAAIRYYTKNGNTKKLAMAIQEELGIAAETIDVPIPNDIDFLFLGTAVQGGKIVKEVKEFITTIKQKNIKVVSFSPTALSKAGQKVLRKQLSCKKIKLLAEEFHCRGGLFIFCRNYPDKKDLENIQKFSKDVVQKYLC